MLQACRYVHNTYYTHQSMRYIRIKLPYNNAAAWYCCTVLYNNHIAFVNGLDTQSADNIIFVWYG